MREHRLVVNKQAFLPLSFLDLINTLDSSMATKEDSKLGRTLKELENALTDWDSLGKNPLQAAAHASRKAKAAHSAEEKEFRKKTKKLLQQLRKQLSDFR